MKRHTFLYIIACILLVGCSEKFDEGLGLHPTLIPRYVAVTPTVLSYSAQASSSTLQVKCAETPWKIENGIDWISTNPSSGSSTASVNVSVTENITGDDARTGIFYVRADVSDWNYESPVSVTQAGATPTILLSKSEIDFTGTPNTETVTVTANCSWVASSSADWLIVSQKDNTITLTVTGNESNSNRTATVSVVHSGTTNASNKITVRQAPASINASTESLVFNNTASSVNVTIDAEASWTASSSASWIDVSPTSGSLGTSTMKVSVSPNTSISERTGYVNLLIGGNQRIQIPVRQCGIYVKTEQSELIFVATGGTQNLSVLSNTNWIVSSVPSWITVSPTQGEGDGSVQVTASDNPNTDSRSGVIHLIQTGMSIDVAINVYQAGKTFDVNTTVLNFDDKSSTQTINVQTDGTWTASASDSWITISPTTASGNSTLSVSVSENTSDNERSGQVAVVMADKSATINIIQKGKYFTISNNLLTYTSKGGTIDVSISTNDSWSAKVEEGSTWLTLSKTNGTGNVEVKVTASDNPSVNSRTATLLFETSHNQKIRVVVTQEARYLRVDTRELLFYPKGGVSEAVTILTDGTYKITCSDSWLSVNQSSNIFTVTATENLGKDPRIGTITIELSDLKEGTYSLSLTVTQLNNGGSFFREGYGNDQDWDNMGISEGSLTITGYTTDKNYDMNTKSVTTIFVSGSQSNKNREELSSYGVKVSTKNHSIDKNEYSSTNISGTVSDIESENDINSNK